MAIPVRLIGTILFLASLTSAAVAQQYPTGPITIVVPFTPGGTTDILGRLAGEVLQNEFKQSAIIENRTGGGGVIGNASVARAAPDGQTLLLAPTAFSIMPFTTKNLPYDPARFRYWTEEGADWGAVDYMLALKGVTREADPERYDRMPKALVHGQSGFPMIGSADDDAQELARISAAGFAASDFRSSIT